MQSFEAVRKYINEIAGLDIPSNISKEEYYGENSFHDKTSADFIDDKEITNVLDRLANYIWLDNSHKVVELQAGDCRNIMRIVDRTKCSGYAIDIEDRNKFIDSWNFDIGDTTKILPYENVDLFLSINGGICVFTDLLDIINHFKAVSEALKDKGFYYTEIVQDVVDLEWHKSILDNGIIYKLIEKFGNSYCMHEFYYETSSDTWTYALSPNQSCYDIEVYIAIADYVGLQLVEIGEFNNYLIFQKWLTYGKNIKS